MMAGMPTTTRKSHSVLLRQRQEAARAGLRAWRKETAPGGSSWGRLQDQDCGLPWSPLFVQESSGHPAERRLAPKWPGGCSAKNTHRIKVKLTLFRLRSLLLGMAGHADDLPFRVELWDNKDSHIEEVIALASDYATARSAYEEASSRPGKLITLRQKTRVIQKSR